jgi:hypothetical protein
MNGWRGLYMLSNQEENAILNKTALLWVLPYSPKSRGCQLLFSYPIFRTKRLWRRDCQRLSFWWKRMPMRSHHLLGWEFWLNPVLIMAESLDICAVEGLRSSTRQSPAMWQTKSNNSTESVWDASDIGQFLDAQVFKDKLRLQLRMCFRESFFVRNR